MYGITKGCNQELGGIRGALPPHNVSAAVRHVEHLARRQRCELRRYHAAGIAALDQFAFPVVARNARVPVDQPRRPASASSTHQSPADRRSTRVRYASMGRTNKTGSAGCVALTARLIRRPPHVGAGPRREARVQPRAVEKRGSRHFRNRPVSDGRNAAGGFGYAILIGRCIGIHTQSTLHRDVQDLQRRDVFKSNQP